MKRLLIFSLLFSVALASCDSFGERIRGNGDVKSETHQVQNFNSVYVSGNIELHITQDVAWSVRIETDQNLMQYIQVRTDGNELRIGVRNHFNLKPTHKIKAYVSAPEFKKLKASGACHVYSDTKISSNDGLYVDISGACHAELDIKAPRVGAELSGACSIKFKGETKDFNADGSGASEVKCFDLMAENVDVDISGACHAEVFASVEIRASASGASGIRYKGDATVVDQHTSGASSVQKVN